MNADLARKRTRQQNSRTHALRLDPSWETNPESTTLLWTCQTCEGLSLPPPWLEQTDEKCAVGKPTGRKGKTRARPLLVRQGLRACVRLCPPVSACARPCPCPQARDTDTDTDLRIRSPSKTRMNHQWANGGSCAHRLSTKTVTKHGRPLEPQSDCIDD